MIRKNLWRILSFITAVILFFLLLWLFSKKQNTLDIENMELTYVFVDENWNEYDLFANQGHWSATDWSFLFQDDDSEDDWSDTKTWSSTNINTEKTTIYTGKKNNTTENVATTGNKITNTGNKASNTGNKTTNTQKTTKSTWNITSQTPNSTVKMADVDLIHQNLSEESREKASKLHIPYELLQQDPELVELIVNSQSIQSNEDKDARLAWISSMTSWQIDELKTTLFTERNKILLLEKKYWQVSWNVLGNKDYVWDTTEDDLHTNKNCVTPWNIVVQDWEYVLAYQQRTDVPDICNVQKRVCHNWVLNGTYTQWYCNEEIEYKYTKVKVKEYNKKDSSQLIQNPKYWKYDGASYDKYGKINGSWNVPTTIWDNQVRSWAIKQETSVSQNKKTHLNCTAPRWDIVIHGQFVKAYASPLGFTDDGCKVELRLCMDGDLQWNYAYSKCKYTNMSYSDYIDGDKTIYDLYNEAYNLTNTSSTDNTTLDSTYENLGDLYWDAEALRSHNMTDDTENLTNKKSFVKKIRDRLMGNF